MDDTAPDPTRRRIGWALVGGQIALIAGLVMTPGGDDWPVGTPLRIAGETMTVAGLAGMAAAALGLGRGLTATPVPNRSAQLRTGGLYAWVRHPIYTALLVFAAGRVVVSGSVVRAVILVALLVLLTGKARFEEKLLTERFAGYPAYAAAVPRFLPRPPRRTPRP
jgi:protein-S-isoprenylcysteine O-methyltransferase Ste14